MSSEQSGGTVFEEMLDSATLGAFIGVMAGVVIAAVLVVAPARLLLGKADSTREVQAGAVGVLVWLAILALFSGVSPL